MSTYDLLSPLSLSRGTYFYCIAFLPNQFCTKDVKTGVILPLFKGERVKANKKDNYRGITLFPAICQTYVMILPNRPENFAKQNKFFSEMQFAFQEGVGCIKASFLISGTMNHLMERGSNILSCFLDVRKAFDTVWVDGLLFKRSQR